MKNKVLIVDDEASIHKTLIRAFQDEPIEFVSAYDGKEGLSLAEKEKPDLIILDMKMPVLDGNETMRRLRADEKTFGIPVLMLTGSGDSIDKIVGYELGVEDYVTKPFRMEELKRRVKMLISEK